MSKLHVATAEVIWKFYAQREGMKLLLQTLYESGGYDDAKLCPSIQNAIKYDIKIN